MRDRLLRADDIDPRGLSGAEIARFRRLLSPTGHARLSRARHWRSSLAKLAVAAGVVLATARAKTFLWTGTSAVVWAAVLRKVNGFDTCVFRTREVTTTGPRPDGFEFATEKESKNYRSETLGSFSETYEDGKLIRRVYTLLGQRQHLYLSEGHRHKLCLRYPVSDEGVREFHADAPRHMLAKILAGEYVEIGTDVIEGKAVRGVELRDPNYMMEEGPEKRPIGDFVEDFAARCWIDVQTELPVWMEISFLPKGSTVRMTTIWDQFEWGVPLEESLFEPEIPADCEVHDHDPSDKTPETKPRTPAEETFAQQTLAEPYLGDFDHLPLPDVCGLSLLGLDPSVPRPQVRLLGDAQIRVAQDECVAKWPPYERVKDQLQQELRARLDIDALDVNRLVTTAIALRNRFWELGGCLSDIAYPYIYAARLLDELAHQREPEKDAIIDQLVESIMSYEVFYYEEDPEPERRRRNPLYTGLLADLRGEQYRLLKARVSHGYVPTWKDFVRCCDLIMLCRWRKDDALSMEVARLLVEQAPKAGWTYDYYLERLQRCAEQPAGPPATFLNTQFDVADVPYDRRLRSFQGPQEYRHNLLPLHLRYLRSR
ncbi:MAG: hypothetical protein M1376_17530 [Planctomycetes bacterium]|nr:hypothetical protein [Planctomycetota bacterium]